MTAIRTGGRFCPLCLHATRSRDGWCIDRAACNYRARLRLNISPWTARRLREIERRSSARV